MSVEENDFDEYPDHIYTHEYDVAYDTPAGSRALHFPGHQQDGVYSVDDVIPVLYLPERPEKAVRYKAAWYRAIGNS